LACWFWRRRFLKIVSVFLLFCDYLPLEKSNPLQFNNLESPSPKDHLCQVWLKLAQWFWRRSRKCKSLPTDGRTDGRRAIRIAHLSFQLRWAKKNPPIYVFTLYSGRVTCNSVYSFNRCHCFLKLLCCNPFALKIKSMN
jgi:hypothetical protein